MRVIGKGKEFMRVIAGSAKRLMLKTVDGKDIRPTTDRIKETLFNILGEHVIQCRFLDLFSGSGAIGIEALSRGAEQAVLVDIDKRSVSCIQHNLQHTHLEDRAVVIHKDVLSAIDGLSRSNEKFDIIFLDPPYGKNLEYNVMDKICNAGIFHDDTIFVVEAAIETDLDYLPNMGFAVDRVKEYKTNQHVFVRVCHG